jgi:hypothetical protein
MGDRTINCLGHWVRHLHVVHHPPVHRDWHLDGAFNDLLHRDRNINRANDFVWNWHILGADDLMWDRHFDWVRHLNWARDFNHFFHNSLHRDLLNALHDLFHRDWDSALHNLFHRNVDGDPLVNGNFVGPLDGPLDNALNGDRNSRFHHSLNGVRNRDVNHTIHRVRDLHFLAHWNRNVHVLRNSYFPHVLDRLGNINVPQVFDVTDTIHKSGLNLLPLVVGAISGTVPISGTISPTSSAGVSTTSDNLAPKVTTIHDSVLGIQSRCRYLPRTIRLLCRVIRHR